MVASLYLSFTDYNLLQAPKWIGLDNFTRMLSDERLHNSLRVTFTYVFVSVPLQLAVALGCWRCVLDRGVRGLAFYRSVFYLPSLLGSQRRDRDPVAADLRHRRACQPGARARSASRARAGSPTRAPRSAR